MARLLYKACPLLFVWAIFTLKGKSASANTHSMELSQLDRARAYSPITSAIDVCPSIRTDIHPHTALRQYIQRRSPVS